jgi:hypothetical protein
MAPRAARHPRGAPWRALLVVALLAAAAAPVRADITLPQRSWRFQYQLNTVWTASNWIPGVTVRRRGPQRGRARARARRAARSA